MVVLDFETTGLSAYSHNILEVAAIRVMPGQDTCHYYQALVKQDRRLPKKITEITGITDDMAASGVDPAEAVEGLLGFVGQDPIVAYNAVFDIGFLNAACEKHITAKFKRGGHSCALKLARRTWDWLPNHRLGTVASHLKLDLSGQHRALDDARRAAEVYRIACMINDVRT
jgi:DNA polymerase III epsilon subunit family exonuclease